MLARAHSRKPHVEDGRASVSLVSKGQRDPHAADDTYKRFTKNSFIFYMYKNELGL